MAHSIMMEVYYDPDLAQINYARCPDCNSMIIPEGSCWYCPVCGYSVCK